MSRRAYLLLPLIAACAATKPMAAPPHPRATPPSVSSPGNASPSSSGHEARKAPAAPTEQTRRLARLGYIWGRVRYFHPYLFDHAIDWDSALVRAIPIVTSAHDEEEEASAVSRMLGELQDPVTRIETKTDRPPSVVVPSSKTSVRSANGVTVVSLATDVVPRGDAFRTLREEVSAASMIVMDLRGDGDVDAKVGALNALAGTLVSGSLIGETKRWISHEGFVTQRGDPAGGYRTTFASDLPRVFNPDAGRHPKRVAFVVDRGVGVPDLVATMQRAGQALIVADGPLPDAADREALTFPFGQHHAVVVRATEVEPWKADIQISGPNGGTHDDGRALDAATTALRTSPPSARPSPQPAPVARSVRDNVYADEKCPPVEHRLLALFRFFTVIDLFYPYKALLDQPWEGVLDEFIPRFIDATTARDYELVVRALSSRLQDSHVWLAGGEALFDWLGHGHLPFHVRRVEGLPVVTSIADVPGVAASGLSIGDIVVGVGGDRFDHRAHGIETYLSGSTAAALGNAADDHALRCHKGDVALRVIGTDNAPREIAVPCVSWFPSPRTGRAIRKIGDIGYVDLERLDIDEVDAMFDTLLGTRGIVFDMRGYPRGTALVLANHLKTDPAPKVAALTATMMVSPLFTDSDTRTVSAQTLVLDPTAKKYRGKTVMLINDLAMSAAEHTGLYLEAANGTKFVGSPSAGANGYTTWVCLPGNLCVTFSGAEVRHGDGRQLQRVGLLPDVPVTQTIRGVREGRDEVLDRAVEYLRAGH